MAARSLQGDEPLEGDFVRLSKLQPAHIPSLWKNLDLGRHPELMEYLPWKPPQNEKHMWEMLHELCTDRGFILFAIEGDPQRVNHRQQQSSSGPSSKLETLGIISYLDIQPQHRALEVGAVLFGHCLQRSGAATEVHYMLLKHALETNEGAAGVPYRRVAWKCNNKNLKSRRAAERLGYVYEGTFRNHMLVNGHSRDSDWLSIIDDEWPAVKRALETWLNPENFEQNGTQIRTLQDIRQSLVKGHSSVPR